MPALLERPKMTKMMYQTLKRHIIGERERKKQAEEEQDAILEQRRKEVEQKKRKEQEDNATLEQTKEQIAPLETKLEKLKQEKHELFSQLKKVLHQEDETRKRAQMKEQRELLSLQQASYPHHTLPPASGHPVLLTPGRPTMYRPATSIMAVSQPVANVPVKRPRSPSPPPASVYQHQYGDSKISSAAKPQPAALYSHAHQQADFKQGSFPQQQQQGPATYVSQSVHTLQQPTVAFSTSKSPAGKYNQPGQSAFSSYPTHYAQHQKSIIDPPFQPTYQIQRMQQPAFLASPHAAASSIPLQQQLQHANDKAGFTDTDKYKAASFADSDKYKIQQQQQQAPMRGVTPIPAQQPGLLPHQSIQLQQATPGKGSIITGYSQKATSTSSYQPSSSQPSYPGQQPGTPGRSGYSQSQGRYY